ncbi:MAG: hypothetical protein K2F87_06265 [Muribaculaceae bacterium]|nr:hypothetical protein [Muribaculaceae bacterium]
MATDNRQKLYVVCFGDSDKYIIRDNAGDEKSKLASIEAELNEFLRAKFPDETFAYYTTPKVEEISDANASQFASYPELDDKAVEAIKLVLEREVADMEAQKDLNDNAPFANVNPAAADIPHILG